MFVTILAYFYIPYLNKANNQCYDQGNTALQALNCLITCSMGALHMGHGSVLCFKTWAQAQQQQQCPVSPWMSVAFLGFSMQIIHLVLTSVSSGDATVFPFSVTKDGLASAADEGVKRSLVIHGFSSGLRLKLKAAAKIKIEEFEWGDGNLMESLDMDSSTSGYICICHDFDCDYHPNYHAWFITVGLTRLRKSLTSMISNSV